MEVFHRGVEVFHRGVEVVGGMGQALVITEGRRCFTEVVGA
jgi:hypothetical protein